MFLLSFLGVEHKPKDVQGQGPSNKYHLECLFASCFPSINSDERLKFISSSGKICSISESD